MVYDHYVVIQEWRTYFRPEDTILSTLCVWVRLPGLPLEYFDHSILKHIGDRIGKTVCIDDTTLEGSRGNFARICVEVDLSKPLLSKYPMRRRVRRIEYESLHTICFNCGCYGHKDDACKQEPEAEAPVVQPNVFANPIFQGAIVSDVRPEVEEDFRPWMQVKKNRRKPPVAGSAATDSSKGAARAKATPVEPIIEKGNRFSLFGKEVNQEDSAEQNQGEGLVPLEDSSTEFQPEIAKNGNKENMDPSIVVPFSSHSGPGTLQGPMGLDASSVSRPHEAPVRSDSGPNFEGGAGAMNQPLGLTASSSPGFPPPPSEPGSLVPCDDANRASLEENCCSL
ncbi:hypothetical protein LINPERHAP2_LOCUS39627 [Linum perenne]